MATDSVRTARLRGGNIAFQRVLEKAGISFECVLEHAGLPHWFGRLTLAA